MALGEPRPRRLRLLASGLASVRVTRVDERTLRVRPAHGFYSTEGERMLRGLSRPFRSGTEVRLSDLRVSVTEVDANGRALEAVFRFERPLDDDSLLWSAWQGSGLRPYVPPPVGVTHTLPPIGLGARPWPGSPARAEVDRRAPAADHVEGVLRETSHAQVLDHAPAK